MYVITVHIESIYMRSSNNGIFGYAKTCCIAYVKLLNFMIYKGYLHQVVSNYSEHTCMDMRESDKQKSASF